jgi:hypothetical protein
MGLRPDQAAEIERLFHQACEAWIATQYQVPNAKDDSS